MFLVGFDVAVDSNMVFRDWVESEKLSCTGFLRGLDELHKYRQVMSMTTMNGVKPLWCKGFLIQPLMQGVAETKKEICQSPEEHAPALDNTMVELASAAFKITVVLFDRTFGGNMVNGIASLRVNDR